MDLLKEIKEHFAAKIEGIRPLTNLPIDCAASTVRMNTVFGVAIEFPREKEVSENSANSKIYTAYLTTPDGKSKKYLLLVCFEDSFRLSFAQLCEHFVEPGENNSNRQLLLDDPLQWWLRWAGLLGDKKVKEMCYSTIAELLALHSLYKKDKSVVWASEHAGSHDIESDTMSYEVKSTIKKSSTTISISSQHQLFSEKKLELLFCRLEESTLGVSINSVRDMLVNEGYDKDLIEIQLFKAGFEKGASIRDLKYKVLETRKYVVDDNFPKITKESFKNDVFPPRVISIKYDLDLEGLPYTPWL